MRCEKIETAMSAEPAKWEGKARVEIAEAKPEQIWPFLEDFSGLNKWFPTLSTCTLIDGVNGEPGCVRYCAGFKTPVSNNGSNNGEVINWTKQKLLSIDPVNMNFCYSIIDGNVGFNGYASTVKLSPKEDDGVGCSIEWKYEVEPVQGWKLEDLDFFIGTGLEVMAKRMTEALQLQTQTN